MSDFLNGFYGKQLLQIIFETLKDDFKEHQSFIIPRQIQTRIFFLYKNKSKVYAAGKQPCDDNPEMLTAIVVNDVQATELFRELMCNPMAAAIHLPWMQDYAEYLEDIL